MCSERITYPFFGCNNLSIFIQRTLIEFLTSSHLASLDWSISKNPDSVLLFLMVLTNHSDPAAVASPGNDSDTLPVKETRGISSLKRTTVYHNARYLPFGTGGAKRGSIRSCENTRFSCENQSLPDLMMVVETPIPPFAMDAAAPDGAPPRWINKTVICPAMPRRGPEAWTLLYEIF